MPTDTRNPEQHVLFIGASAVPYCFDLQDFYQITGGETIVSATVDVTNPEGSDGVTFGTPVVLTEDFIQYDRNGNAMYTVPEAKGVKVAVTPGDTPITVTATCLATFSGGSRDGKQVVFKVQ